LRSFICWVIALVCLKSFAAAVWIANWSHVVIVPEGSCCAGD